MPIVGVMEPTRLPDHPAFLRLAPADRTRLFDAAEIWEGRKGCTLYYPGDSGEDLLLLLDGRLEYADRRSGERRWMAGELWGADRMAGAEPLNRALVAAEDSRWLSWSRTRLQTLFASHPALARDLSPLPDQDGTLLSGFPVSPGERSVGGRLPGTSSRKFRGSFRPIIGPFVASGFGALVIRMLLLALDLETLPATLPLAAPALFLGWFVIFLISRLLREYRLNSDALITRSFNWSRFIIESRHVPIDRIQGVEVERNGLVRRVLNYGSLIVKTSALDGELVLRDIGNPEKLAAEIRDMGAAGNRRLENRSRETMRRTLENAGLADNPPRLIRTARLPDASLSQRAGIRKFRKSPAVLFGRLILPLLCTSVPVFAAGMLAEMTGKPAGLFRLAAVLPLFWFWYVFEDWRNDSFHVAGGYAVDLYRKPLGLKQSRSQVDLASVQNIRTEQKGFFSFLFRYGDVILVTAGGASDTVFQNVSRPWTVQETLFRSREEALKQKADREIAERKDELLRFAEAMEQLRGSSR